MGCGDPETGLAAPAARPCSASCGDTNQDGQQPARPPQVPSGQGAGGPGGRGHAIHGVDQPEGHAGHGVLRVAPSAVTQQRLEAFGFAPSAGTPSERGNRRGCLPGHAVDGLEAPAFPPRGPLSFDIFALSNRHTPHYVELTRAVTDTLQPSPTRLKNAHNVCYLNSCAQALHWIGRLADSPDACYGAAKAALRILSKAGTANLPACLPWTPCCEAGSNSRDSMMLLSFWATCSKQQFHMPALDTGNPVLANRCR